MLSWKFKFLCCDECCQWLCFTTDGEVEEKKKFWSEINVVVRNFSRDENVVIGAYFNGHYGKCDRSDKKVMDRCASRERT